MENKKEMTAPNVSVGADTEQPSQKSTANIITTEDERFKSFEEIQRKMIVGLSMMCYRLGKENKTALGECQLRGRIGKLLYWLCRTASCFSKSAKE